ncbi:MAG: hypothetical protein KGI83_04110, partial [Verrucomicrobiota bacterium]|nr:hypothetical protein [Verrucomicrobiota bacterium]
MRLRLRLYACLEIGIFFLVLFGIAYCFDLPYNYYDFTLHPFWIIVILMAAQYGTNEGLLAAAVSAVILLAGKHPPHNYLLDSFDYLFALIKLPLLWFVTAVVLGELRFKHIREYQTVKAVAAAAERREQEI